MTIGERIRKARRTLDLTQAEFASRIRSTQNTVTRYETGDRTPSASVITLICLEFDVNETWLRTGEGEMFVKYSNTALEEIAVDFYLDAFDQALVDEYIHLTPDQRKTFRTFFYRVLVKSVGDAGPNELLQAEMRNYPTTRIRDDILVPPPADTSARDGVQPDIIARMAELERQNRALAAKVAAMEEEDTRMEAAGGSSTWEPSGGGTRLA